MDIRIVEPAGYGLDIVFIDLNLGRDKDFVVRGGRLCGIGKVELQTRVFAVGDLIEQPVDTGGNAGGDSPFFFTLRQRAILAGWLAPQNPGIVVKSPAYLIRNKDAQDEKSNGTNPCFKATLEGGLCNFRLDTIGKRVFLVNSAESTIT